MDFARNIFSALFSYWRAQYACICLWWQGTAGNELTAAKKYHNYMCANKGGVSSLQATDLYQAIFKRKSTRKYDLTPLADHTLKEIADFLARVTPLNSVIRTEFKFVAPQDVTSLLPVQAPHYIVAFSESKPGYLTNMGFMLQQLDLYLSARGIGSCWLGIPRPTKAIRHSSPLEFVIIMSFGLALQPVHRESIHEFKRKPLTAITSITGMDELMEAACLAPSATNSQPWFFTGGKDRIHAYCVQTNPIKALIYKKMNQIDMGIALYHLIAAANHHSQELTFVHDDEACRQPPADYYYITTALLSESSINEASSGKIKS